MESNRKAGREREKAGRERAEGEVANLVEENEELQEKVDELLQRKKDEIGPALQEVHLLSHGSLVLKLPVPSFWRST